MQSLKRLDKCYTAIKFSVKEVSTFSGATIELTHLLSENSLIYFYINSLLVEITLVTSDFIFIMMEYNGSLQFLQTKFLKSIDDPVLREKYITAFKNI